MGRFRSGFNDGRARFQGQAPQNPANFNGISRRRDFAYVTSEKITKRIEYDLYNLPNSRTQAELQERRVVLLEYVLTYLNNLKSVHELIRRNFGTNEGMEAGKAKVSGALTECIRFLQNPNNAMEEFLGQRGRFLKEFRDGRKNWMIGLERIKEGASGPNDGRTRNGKKKRQEGGQVQRGWKWWIHHIMDRKRGCLGEEYLFNKRGKYSPFKVFGHGHMALKNLKLASELLERRIRGESPLIKGKWEVMGKSHQGLRILLKRRNVYFVFPSGEHDKNYMKTLVRGDPTRIDFLPASQEDVDRLTA